MTSDNIVDNIVPMSTEDPTADDLREAIASRITNRRSLSAYGPNNVSSPVVVTRSVAAASVDPPMPTAAFYVTDTLSTAATPYTKLSVNVTPEIAATVARAAADGIGPNASAVVRRWLAVGATADGYTVEPPTTSEGEPTQ